MAFGSSTRASSLLLLVGATTHRLLTGVGVAAFTFDVTANGVDDTWDLSEAMSSAQAGDIVSLADGTYDQAIVSENDGEPGNPITVVGGRGAIINGDFNSRSVLIKHSFITLKVHNIRCRILFFVTLERKNGRVSKFFNAPGDDAGSTENSRLGQNQHAASRGRGGAGRGGGGFSG